MCGGVVVAPGPAVMVLRLAPIAVISLSCANANGIGGSVDGSVNPPHDGPHAIDAPGKDIDAPVTPPDATPTDAALACKPPNIIHGDGKHNPTMNCMDACHSHGFSVAGTVFLSDGTTPAVNATVTVVDAGNNSQDIIVSTNGNFFSYFPVQYPITVSASLCPDTQVMVSHPTSGACNSPGCHEPGGLQGLTHL